MNATLIAVVVFIAANAAASSVRTCGGNGKITLKSVKLPNEISKDDARIVIQYENNMDFNPSDLIEVKLESATKKLFFWSIDLLPRLQSQFNKINDKDVTYVPDNKFRFGCPLISRIAPCPPPRGLQTEVLDLGPALTKARNEIGGFLATLLSGTFTFKASMSKGGQELLCVEGNVEVKI